MSREEYVRSLTSERVCSAMARWMASITRHAHAIRAIQEHVHQGFDAEACGQYHGPAHWARVSQHALAVSRSLGIDPLVPYIFGLVHDSQRQDDGLDPEHGPRATAFVRERRDDLFGFLADAEIDALAEACDRHSDGETDGEPWVRVCFDADRLDLARVSIRPDPDYLCTEYARRPEVIAAAMAMSGCADDTFDKDFEPESELFRDGT